MLGYHLFLISIFSANTLGGVKETNGRQRHPPHLKGKEIGLYYARKQREKKEEAEEMSKDMLEISDDQIEKIEKLLGPKLCQLNSNWFGKNQAEADSEFMMAYNRNLALNSQTTCLQTKSDLAQPEKQADDPKSSVLRVILP